MNIYVVGHGFLFVKDLKKFEKLPIAIPKDITVKFYCKELTYYEFQWDKEIFIKNFKVGDSCPIKVAKEAWEVEEKSMTCYEHLLTRPGGPTMKLSKPTRAMKKITPNQDGTSVIIESFQDGDLLYINDPNNCTCKLSAILNYLAEIKFKGVLNWLACRNAYPYEDSEERDVIIKQAKEEISEIKKQPVLPRKQPTSITEKNSSQISVLDYPDAYACNYASIDERGRT